LDDPKVIAAIVAGITSLIVTILTLATKNPIEKAILLFRLDSEHLYEQKKAVRESVTKRKQQILSHATQLNDRLANYSANYKKAWLDIDGWGDYLHQSENGSFTHPYIISFAYRIAAFYALLLDLENSVVHFDRESASEQDMALLSYASVFQHIFTDCHIAIGIESEHTLESRPHLSNTELRRAAEFCLVDSGVIEYEAFIKKAQEDFTPVLPIFLFLNGINPDCDIGLRAQRLQLLHLTLMCFIADFGYVHQASEANNIEKWVNKYTDNLLYGYILGVLVRAGIYTKPPWIGPCKTYSCRLIRSVRLLKTYNQQAKAEEGRFSWTMGK
jgi:hypothetical protein